MDVLPWKRISQPHTNTPHLVHSFTSGSAQHTSQLRLARLAILFLTVLVAIGCIICFTCGVRGAGETREVVSMATKEDNDRDVLDVKGIKTQATSPSSPSFGFDFHCLYTMRWAISFRVRCIVQPLLASLFFSNAQVDCTLSFLEVLDQKVDTIGLCHEGEKDYN